MFFVVVVCFWSKMTGLVDDTGNLKYFEKLNLLANYELRCFKIRLSCVHMIIEKCM